MAANLDMLDTVIVGGSSAGLSAALILGRSMRRVVVVDDEKPCNRFSRASHGFLTRDGTPPGELRRAALGQLRPYPSVTLNTTTALHVEKTGAGFEVTSADGSVIQARTVLLATGLRDELPALEGAEALWGQSVFHCPYCDGYEVRGEAIAVYGTDSAALHQIMLLRNLTDDLTLCTGGAWDPPETVRAQLSRWGIRVIEQPVAALESAGTQLHTVRFGDGTSLGCRALFVRPRTTHRSPFARDLGCDVDERGVVRVDLRGRTGVAGVYAAGDIASPMRSVALAVGQGASAAYGINADLSEQDWLRPELDAGAAATRA